MSFLNCYVFALLHRKYTEFFGTVQTDALTLSHINICNLNFKKNRNFASSFKQAMLHDCVADTLSFGMAQTNALECLPTYS